MSAMTGPRHSPSSPWHQDTQNQPLASASIREFDRPSLDAGTSHHHTVSGHLSPNYFALGANDASHPHDVKQSFHARNSWDTASQPYTQSSIPSQRPQLLPRKSVFEDTQGDYMRGPTGNERNRRTSVFHGLPWNPELQSVNSSERTVTLHSTPRDSYFQEPEHAIRNSHRPDVSQMDDLRSQDSMQQTPYQPPHSFQMSFQGGLANTISRHGTPESGSQASHPAHGVNFVSAERCAELVVSAQHELILLDVRPFTHFTQSNIRGSLNLCIPTTLVKRPSFDTRKLENTFTDDSAKMNFARWRQCHHIVVYDTATADPKDAGPLSNLLRKFTIEGWDGEGMILKGGFKTFSNCFPGLTQNQQGGQSQTSAKAAPKKPTSMHISLPAVAPVAGGCALPESSATVIPFFGNIRQHMDLLGGVGQTSLQLPKQLTESKRRLLPIWLRDASNPSDRGHSVSQRFLKLEEKELERMKQAFSYELTADAASSKKYRIAGIEKGTKNRYNDIYPFDHSRVRLQNEPISGCDYVNANHMEAEYSNKSYIATQAPVPDTFNDFWRVVWEQDVRLVVALTAELERGQVKCHPYWESGTYGPLQVKNFSQRYVYMDRPGSSLANDSDIEPSAVQPGSNQPNEGDDPCIIVRHFGLSHSAFPFQPLREVTQLQYPYWPDFGTTAQPFHLLQLIEQCNQVIEATSNAAFSSSEAEPQGQRPVLVHCSAGCGRTGTFCAVDSVLDMLKRQRSRAQDSSTNDNDNSADGWVYNEEQDLIAKTVADFRTQRPSMVQNLSQFVLCYESVLEWVVSQMSDGDDISQ